MSRYMLPALWATAFAVASLLIIHNAIVMLGKLP